VNCAYLKHLYLRNFRNYAEAEVQFSPNVNVIWGDNAQGKTSLLEAIHLLSTGRSFRSQHLSELIREGEHFFYLEGEVVLNQISQSIKLSFDGRVKRLEINSSVHSSFAPLLGSLPLVLHAPGDTELISGSPSLRRRFLNLHLAQSDPLYVHHLTRFWRAMKQRNCLLRNKTAEPIECWEDEMVRSAAYLHKMRSILIEELKTPLEIHGKVLSASLELHELRYHPSHPDDYLHQLRKNRHRERDLGMTLVGPHRDDLSFWIGGKSARIFASEGQKKTAIASLRLAEWDQLAHRLGHAPLMAIDDFGLSFDPSRQTLFHEKLALLGQVLITTPSPIFDIASHNIQIQNGNPVFNMQFDQHLIID
jgi:DNA replication and repair protein RecF